MTGTHELHCVYDIQLKDALANGPQLSVFDLTYLTSVGSPLTKAFHLGLSYTIWAALVVSRPAEWRSCLMESAHLVFGRPIGLFQSWMFGLKSKTLRTGREDGVMWR